MGGGENQDGSHDNELIDMITMSLGMGCTHIDPVEKYGSGHEEELV